MMDSPSTEQIRTHIRMRMYFSSTRLRTLVDRVHAGGMWVAGAGGALAHRTYRSMLGLNERAPIGDVCAAALGAVGFRLDASDPQAYAIPASVPASVPVSAPVSAPVSIPASVPASTVAVSEPTSKSISRSIRTDATDF